MGESVKQKRDGEGDKGKKKEKKRVKRSPSP